MRWRLILEEFGPELKYIDYFDMTELPDTDDEE